MLADAVGNARKLRLGPLAVDDDMAEPVAERDEITLGIDDDLLHPLRRLLEQTAQKMRLARSGIALHQQTGRQQLLDIERRRAAGRQSHIDANLQC